MSGSRGERDLCKNKNRWQSPFKLIKKNKYVNEKKEANEKKKKIKKKKRIKKNKKQSSPGGGSNLGKMVLEAVALSNEPRKHRLSGDQIYNI